KAHDALLIVDGITAVGGLENRMEQWGIDALVMGSQKCLAAPPGLSAVALSERAYASLHSDTSFYLNLKAHVDALAKQDTPFTPAVPLFLAFREALHQLKEEGLESRIARTARLADATRAAIRARHGHCYRQVTGTWSVRYRWSTTVSAREARTPPRCISRPVHAIMAPLSMHRSPGGTNIFASRSAAIRPTISCSLLLRATPP